MIKNAGSKGDSFKMKTVKHNKEKQQVKDLIKRIQMKYTDELKDMLTKAKANQYKLNIQEKTPEIDASKSVTVVNTPKPS